MALVWFGAEGDDKGELDQKLAIKVPSARQHPTCLHATNSQRKADTQIMTVGPFGW